jgi:flagellar biosynthesis/type III secretory pathway M-ring protein FliF/YscJ
MKLDVGNYQAIKSSDHLTDIQLSQNVTHHSSWQILLFLSVLLILLVFGICLRAVISSYTLHEQTCQANSQTNAESKLI